MSTYDPNTMPTTMEEWEALISYRLKESQDEYDASCAVAIANAKAQYQTDQAANPELSHTLDDYLDVALAQIPQPKTRSELEEEYGCYLAAIQQSMSGPDVEDTGVTAESIYRLGDGRLYDIAAGAFIAEAAAGAHVVAVPHIRENADLARTLEFYHLPVGACLYNLEGLRQVKLKDLASAFNAACASASLMSSVGFEIDADETANRNVEGLIKRMENDGFQSVDFCAADNSVHPVSLADLKTMQLEIIAYGQELYARKWALRSAIMAAATKEDLAAIAIEL